MWEPEIARSVLGSFMNSYSTNLRPDYRWSIVWNFRITIYLRYGSGAVKLSATSWRLAANLNLGTWSPEAPHLVHNDIGVYFKLQYRLVVLYQNKPWHFENLYFTSKQTLQLTQRLCLNPWPISNLDENIWKFDDSEVFVDRRYHHLELSQVAASALATARDMFSDLPVTSTFKMSPPISVKVVI